MPFDVNRLESVPPDAMRSASPTASRMNFSAQARKFSPLSAFLLTTSVLGILSSASLHGATPAPAATIEPLCVFGIGSDSQTGRNLTPWVPQMAEIGIRMMRTCKPDQMDYLTGLGFKFGGLLYGVPADDKLDAHGTLPVKDLAAWSAYVADYVKQANGRVKYWEVWNEPPNGTGRDQTPADYAKIVVSSYDTARGIDPTCLVGLAAKSVHVNYLEQVIKAGAKDHFDFIVLHPYEMLDGIADNIGSEPQFMSIVPTVRKMLAAQNPEKQNVPIIFTELGCDAKKGLDVQGQALVKAYTMGIAQGVACIEWFEGIDGDSGPMGLLDRKGNPRPCYTAMAQMIQHLGQHPEYLGWILLNDKDYAFVFKGAKGTVLITWATRKGADHIDFGKPMEIVDPLTGKSTSASSYDLTSAPILALDVSPALIVKAKANAGHPLPWGGDYANAKSVSITTTEAGIVEKGLHSHAGANVAEAVVAYGGSARAGDVPGGNVFMVDPNFLSYQTVPIEITVVVRRNENNDNAGFKLTYESTNGFKNMGWYTVPDNKEWHTMKWTIKDAQFVSMWGFNFSLNSDGNKYNKYYIQSVTVTKLAP